MDLSDLRARMNAAEPRVSTWIAEQIAANMAASRPAADAGFGRLRDYLPEDLLKDVRVLTVARAPFLPFLELGLPEFVLVERMAVAGITYRNFCFLTEATASESTCFHELIHALEWRALGERYLHTYAAGLLQFGVAGSPLEVIACDMQSQFDRGVPVPDLVAAVEAGALAAGRQAEAFFQSGTAT